MPLQIDVTAKHGVQIEVHKKRGVAYMHVDGYTACRVNFKGLPCDIEVDPQPETVDLVKVAKFIAGVLMTQRFLTGQESTIKLSGPEVDKVEQETIEQLRRL